MKKKYNYIKNPVFQLCLVLLMTNCGGGGSNSPRSVAPTKIIVDNEKPSIETPNIFTNNKSAIEITNNNSNTGSNNRPTPPKVENNDKVIKGTLTTSFNFSTPIIPKGETKGEELVVGVLDSDFLTHQDNLKKKYGDKIIILDKNERYYTDYGEIVLETLLEGISPKVIVSSLSSEYQGNSIIKYSLEDYKKS